MYLLAITLLGSCGKAPFSSLSGLASNSDHGVSSATATCDLKKFKPSFISAMPGDGQVELRWQPNGDPSPIVGYFGRYWEGSDFTNDPPNPPKGRQGNGNPLNYFPVPWGSAGRGEIMIKGTSYTVTGLQNGKTYTFGIMAKEPQRCGYGWEVYISATPTP